MSLPVFVHNIVVPGFGRGSKQLDCPTANVAAIEHLSIPTGIYCGLVQLLIKDESQLQEEEGHRQTYDDMLNSLPYQSPVKPMVCSFGYNPQFGNDKRSLEVHILDRLNFNFYAAELRVVICKKMRDEQKYGSLEELKNAITNDIIQANKDVKQFAMLSSNASYFLPPSASTIDKLH